MNSEGSLFALNPNAYIESLTKTIFLLRDRMKLYAHDDLTVHALTVCLQNTREEIQGIFDSAPADMEFARQMLNDMPDDTKARFISALETESVAQAVTFKSTFTEKLLAFGKPA